MRNLRDIPLGELRAIASHIYSEISTNGIIAHVLRRTFYLAKEKFPDVPHEEIVQIISIQATNFVDAQVSEFQDFLTTQQEPTL